MAVIVARCRRSGCPRVGRRRGPGVGPRAQPVVRPPPTRRPAASSVVEHDRDAAGRGAPPRCRAPARPVLSAASTSTGKLDDQGHGLGRRALHLPHHQLAAVGGGRPVHPAPVVPGPVGPHPRGSPMSRGDAVARCRRSASSAGPAAAAPRPGGARCAVGGEGHHHGRAHHMKPKGAAVATSSVTASVHAPPAGHEDDRLSVRARAAAVPRRPDRRSCAGPERVEGRTRTRVVASTTISTRKAGGAVAGRVGDATARARAHTTPGPSSPRTRVPATTSPEGLHPAGPAVVGHEPPRQKTTAQRS